ncbi:MAG: sugar ABC transporter permease [Actinomycetales bacterium]|nr:MAG: sugar ABC transporter permease [Actinomycetales bacterium]
MTSKKSKFSISRTIVNIVLLVAGIAMAFPFVWMVLTSLKTLPQLLSDPLSVIPDPATVSNYTKAFDQVPFGQAYLNSAYITALTVIGTLLTASMAAYGFGRIRFPGTKVLFILFLATQMIPKQVTLIPTYILMAKLGWVDSHLSIIVPGMMVNPFAVFLLRQFVLSLPVELEEAAMIDGASRLQIFFRVILPNLKPGLAALAIITAIDAWNNFLLPLVLLNDPELFTVPLLLSQFRGKFAGINYGLIMAGSAIATIPVLIVFLVAQKRIINAMVGSGFGGK